MVLSSSRKAISVVRRLGRRLRVAPGFDDALLPDLRRHFDAYSSISFANYPVQDLPGEPVAIG